MSWGIIFYMSDLSRLLVYSSTRNYKNDGFAGRFCIIAKVHYYENTAKTFCRIFVQAITSRALRIFFLGKPLNYTLAGLTICCIVGCVCMVCALNPTLMTGLSCPEMGWPFFMLFPEKTVDMLISIIPGQIFLLCLKRFIICAEKVCYKLCNMYYKLCNMCYKLSNMCYKLCNKNFLIGKEKIVPRK